LLEPSVNIICSWGLNRHQFRTFSAGMWSELRDVPYRNWVQCFGCGRLLSRLSAPRKQIDVFLHEKKLTNLCNHQWRLAKEIGGFRGSNKVHRDARWYRNYM